jgi:hypothetical protein
VIGTHTQHSPLTHTTFNASAIYSTIWLVIFVADGIIALKHEELLLILGLWPMILLQLGLNLHSTLVIFPYESSMWDPSSKVWLALQNFIFGLSGSESAWDWCDPVQLCSTNLRGFCDFHDSHGDSGLCDLYGPPYGPSLCDLCGPLSTQFMSMGLHSFCLSTGATI